MRSIKIAAFVLVYCLSFSMCCVFNDNCVKNHTFQIPFTTYPLEDTLSIGDTLWIRANFSHEFNDLNSGELYVLENFTYFTEFNIAQIDTTVLIEAAPKFGYVIKEGNFTTIPLTGGFFVGLIEYKYQNDAYISELGLIPLYKGVYGFSFSSPVLEDLDNGISVSISDDCESENVNIVYITNEGEHNNYYLLQNSPIPEIPEIESVDFEKYKESGVYAFVVKE